MIDFKQYILERRIKDETHLKGFYLENPTASELIGIFNKSKRSSLRLLLFNDTLYAWDAYYATHGDFAYFVLGYDNKTISQNGLGYGQSAKKSNIDPFVEDEGTRIGTDLYKPQNKKHYDSVIGLINYIEKQFKLQMVDQNLNSSYWKYFHFEQDISESYMNKAIIPSGSTNHYYYYKNPTQNQIIELINKTKTHSMRFVIDVDFNLYVWDAYNSTHQTFAYHNQINVDFNDHRLYGYIEKKIQIDEYHFMPYESGGSHVVQKLLHQKYKYNLEVNKAPHRGYKFV